MDALAALVAVCLGIAFTAAYTFGFTRHTDRVLKGIASVSESLKSRGEVAAEPRSSQHVIYRDGEAWGLGYLTHSDAEEHLDVLREEWPEREWSLQPRQVKEAQVPYTPDVAVKPVAPPAAVPRDSGKAVFPGEMLLITAPYGHAICYHAVGPGETLRTIALKYHISAEAIYYANRDTIDRPLTHRFTRQRMVWSDGGMVLDSEWYREEGHSP